MNASAAERMARRKFWLAWAERAQRELASLLADTVDEEPADSDAVFECVNQLIDVEQQLAALIHPQGPFRWSRHPDGSWSASGYEIKRENSRSKWRLLRDGEFWDAVEKLPHAKSICERDYARRLLKEGPATAATSGRQDEP